MNSVGPNLAASSRTRWIRLALQTAFGLALLWLWLRTVSPAEVASHMRANAWWPIPPGEGTFPAGAEIEVRPIPGDYSA